MITRRGRVCPTRSPACHRTDTPQATTLPTPCVWRDELAAHFAHPDVSNGPTENLNLKIKNTKRIARGYRNFAPLPAAVIAQPRPHPRRSLTDANQNPRSQVRCVSPFAEASGSSVPDGLAAHTATRGCGPGNLVKRCRGSKTGRQHPPSRSLAIPRKCGDL